MTPGVWVTRPEPGNRRTSRVLEQAGYTVLPVPVLEIRNRAIESWPSPDWPDWILFVSANAVEGFEAAVRAGTPRGDRGAVRVGVVGAATAERARTAGWTGVQIPDREDARGLLDHLVADSFDGATVWIPTGNRPGSATDLLPAALAARGARVHRLPVYETRLRIPDPLELERLEHALPGAVVIHSGSSAEAVFGSGVPGAYRRWREAPVVAIGTASAEHCRRLAGSAVLECASPADEAVLEALERVPALHPERKGS